MTHLLDAYDDEFYERHVEDDGPAECVACGEVYPESALRDGVCADCETECDIFTQVEEAQLVKPEGLCVTLAAHDGVEWDV